jgi:hypothetical protein
MDIKAAESRRQLWVVKFIVYTSLFFSFVCLVPIVLDNSFIHDSYGVRFIPNMALRTAALGTTIPLICDSIYDTTLPHRLTYPRFILVLSMFLPNVIAIVSSLCHADSDKNEVALTLAAYLLFTCGLAGYIAGEVVDKRLLYYLAVSAPLLSILCCLAVYGTIFGSLAISRTAYGTMVVILRVFFLGVLIWCLHDMKLLDARRKVFARIYAAAMLLHLFVPMVVIIALSMQGQNASLHANFMLVYQILLGSFVTIIPTRMVQHDALMMMVGHTSYRCFLCLINN